MPLLEISPGVPAETTTESIDQVVRYSLSGLYVALSPHVDDASHESLLRETVGSAAWLWSADDEFRFAKSDGSLRGLVLTTPEVSLGDDAVRSWTELPMTPGGLRLSERANFEMQPTDVRWISADGETLICARGDLIGPGNRDGMRLRVGDGLDLVFTEGVLAGWVLRRPASFLVREWEFPDLQEPRSPGLSSVLKEYLHVVKQPEIDAVQEGNETVLAELDSLRSKATRLPSDARRDVIIEQIDELCSAWR